MLEVKTVFSNWRRYESHRNMFYNWFVKINVVVFPKIEIYLLPSWPFGCSLIDRFPSGKCNRSLYFLIPTGGHQRILLPSVAIDALTDFQELLLCFWCFFAILLEYWISNKQCKRFLVCLREAATFVYYYSFRVWVVVQSYPHICSRGIPIGSVKLGSFHLVALITNRLIWWMIR